MPSMPAIRSPCSSRSAAPASPPSPPPRKPREPGGGRSVSIDLGEPLAMVVRVSERHPVPARPFEPEVQVVLPGEADAAVHLDRPTGGAGVDVAEPRLGDGRGPRRLAW